jgi:hypothetical protein
VATIDSSISEGVFYFSKDAAHLLPATDTAAQLGAGWQKRPLAAVNPAALAGVPYLKKVKKLRTCCTTSMPVWPDVALANVTEVTTVYAGRQLQTMQLQTL